MRHKEKYRTGWLMDESAMLDAYEGKECEACGMRGDDCECKLEPEPEPEKETKDMSKYYWKITGAKLALGLVSEIGTVGPYNADETITENKGRFRMKDGDHTIYYHGEIYGDYDGFEPLDDFGMPNAGCTSIEYNEKGEWKQL